MSNLSPRPDAPSGDEPTVALEQSAVPEATPPAAGTPEFKPRRKRRFVPAPPVDDSAVQDVWLSSYADMVTLLLTMFVALLLNAHFGPGPKEAGSEEGPRKFIENLLQLHVASPYGDGEYIITGSRDAPAAATPKIGSALAVVRDEDLERIRKREDALRLIQTRLQETGLAAFIKAEAEGDGIRLNIPNSILFRSGEADLQGNGPRVIATLGPILQAATFTISVEGHTDNIPIKTERYPSNWELSAQRAATVVRTLAESGIGAQRLEAVGYADARPLADNSTDDGRMENRRVAIFLRLER